MSYMRRHGRLYRKKCSPAAEKPEPFGLTCPTCGKQSYLSRGHARRVARRKHPALHLRAYRCGQYWHLARMRGNQ